MQNSPIFSSLFHFMCILKAKCEVARFMQNFHKIWFLLQFGLILYSVGEYKYWFHNSTGSSFWHNIRKVSTSKYTSNWFYVVFLDIATEKSTRKGGASGRMSGNIQPNLSNANKYSILAGIQCNILPINRICLYYFFSFSSYSTVSDICCTKCCNVKLLGKKHF